MVKLNAWSIALAITPVLAQLPIVNLGYQKQQALIYNSTGDYYMFSNIRYAAPPIGENRWKAPQPPAHNPIVQNGSQSVQCPQADPAWTTFAYEWFPTYLAGGGFNKSISQLNALNDSIPTSVPGGSTEDCLFLDVYSPKSIFDKASSKPNGTGAPVLVWIYGGGYTLGNKNSPAAGLIHASQASGSQGIVYVALNYRLGAFGWLAGPTFQEDGVANAGLHDQRFALKWVKKNIHLFGGDPKRVTVMGESAGGGSIMHQITAYGGLKPVPFQQAILQSPAWLPQVSNFQLESQFNRFLYWSNATSLSELRNLSTEALQLANIRQVHESIYGTFNFGPAVDGSFVPALPGKLLLQGSFNKKLKVMVGHNQDEGILFTDPFTSVNDTQPGFSTYIKTLLPTANDQVIDYLENVLYPPNFHGAANYTYTDGIGRASFSTAESTFTCNTNYLDRAFKNKTYSYLFAVPPAIHGNDVPYTFYNGEPASSTLNTTVAVALQEYITSFVQTSVPSAAGIKGLPKFQMYGPQASIQDLNVTSITSVIDPTMNSRCLWWQKALYL